MLIRGGVYSLKETVVFSLEDSAPAGGTITYAAYGDETPVFTSAVPIGGWIKPEHASPLLPEIARDLVSTADVPPSLSNVLTLYDGNNRLRRAWSKPFRPVAFSDAKSPPTRSRFPRGRCRTGPTLQWGAPRDPSCDYEMCLLPLAKVDEKAGLAKTTVPASRTMGRVKFMDETAWVENILEVLDEPGEWVFNAAERKLYLWPTHGAPSDAITAPRLTELLRIEGVIDYDGPADKPVTGLVFRGLTFTGGERLPWNGATKGELQHKWEHFDLPSALLRLRGAGIARSRPAGSSTRAEPACGWISPAWITTSSTMRSLIPAAWESWSPAMAPAQKMKVNATRFRTTGSITLARSTGPRPQSWYGKAAKTRSRTI